MERWRVYLFDSLAAVGLAAMLVVVQLRGMFGLEDTVDDDAVSFGLLVGAGLVFAIRSRWPLGYVACTVVLSLTYILLGYEPGPVYLMPFLALFVLYTTVAERYWLPLSLLIGSAFVLAINWRDLTMLNIGYTMTSVAVVAGSLALTVHLYRRRVSAITERAEVAERTREQEAQRRVAEERLRIARDLHDVVAHKLATISLQAGVAAHLAEGDASDDARDALHTIRGVSNEALTELRAVLGLLRDDDPGTGDGPEARAEAGGDGAGAPPLAPTRTLSSVPDLVATMRAAGLRVDDQLAFGDAAVPEMVATAAYRVVQEALTNVARHVGAGTRVRLRVTRLAEALEVEVVNEVPDGASVSCHDDGGRGITGMRERVAALGGAFGAGPEPGGEFRVWALLPVERTRPGSVTS